MAKSPGNAYRRWVLALLSLCVVAGFVIVGSMLLKDGSLRFPFFAEPAGIPESPTRVVYVTEYLKCGDQVVESRDYSPEEISSVLASLSPSWVISKNTEFGVELKRQVDGYCDKHLRFRLITLYRGYVCVFRGVEPDPSFIVKERPDIREVDLIERDRAFLRKGDILEAAPNIPDDEVSAFLDREVAIYLEGIKEH